MEEWSSWQSSTLITFAEANCRMSGELVSVFGEKKLSVSIASMNAWNEAEDVWAKGTATNRESTQLRRPAGRALISDWSTKKFYNGSLWEVLPPATKLRQGNVFCTCLWFCSQGVSVRETPLDREPPDKDPPGQRPRWTETPWTETSGQRTPGQTPPSVQRAETALDRDPPDRDPPDRDPPGQRHYPPHHMVMSRQYASYWNVFLFY